MRALLRWTALYCRTGKKHKVNSQDLVPSLSDLQEAEAILIQEIQMKHFEKEIGKLLQLKVRDPRARQELRSKD